MDAERWKRIEQVLDDVLEHDPAEWPRLVRDACGDDQSLRREVEQLLTQHGHHSALLESGPGAVAASLLHDAETRSTDDVLIGTTLGVWHVVREIGRGGMSRVFLGERIDGAYSHRVAIKVLRAGLDSASDRERFRTERQILASLDHPYIARLLDGGVTPDGRPYLVLEFIEGQPLTAFCRDQQLPIPARIRLFLSVAEATQSAHRQLVVHRDLKPSNILVSADGRPRLLDFGIAKIVDPSERAAGNLTATRRRWFTPEYAAPEQFTGGAVTTATDVYQLGVVLYELLSERRPFDDADTTQSLQDRVQFDDPPAPSTYVAELRGDLDAVILKALRKEPLARYASVSEFATDLQRVLDGEPVAARTGNRAYRWRRIARRRALPLSIAAVSLVAATVYMSTLVLHNRRITAALADATIERQKSEQLSAFLLGMFDAIDPLQARGDTVSARELLERGEARANALEGSPIAQAQMLDAIGRARTGLGAFPDARASLERALAIRRRELGESHADVAQSIANVAKLDQLEGRSAAAALGYRTALSRQRLLLGERAPATQRSLFDLAFTLHAAGRQGDAQPFFTEWSWLSKTRIDRRDALSARQLEALSAYVLRHARGDTMAFGLATRLIEEAQSIRRAVGGFPLPEQASASGRMFTQPGPDLASLLVSYANRIEPQGRTIESTALRREAWIQARHQYGDGHLMTAVFLGVYGDALRRTGAYAEAEQALRDAERGLTQNAGAQNLMTVRIRIFLGDALRALGRFDEAEALLQPAFEGLLAKRGPDDTHARFAREHLVRLYETAGRPADAARYQNAESR